MTEEELEQQCSAISEKRCKEMMAVLRMASEYARQQRERLAKISDPVVRERLRKELMEWP